MKKFTLQEIIEKANEVHNNFYSYDKAVFVNTKTPLTITCPHHGDFKLIVNTHLKGGGCSECRKVAHLESKGDAGKEFIEKARKIHGNTYSYDKLEYVTNRIDVIITCAKHGDFKMRPTVHLRGSGCGKCRKELLGTPNEEYRQRFIEKARKVHGDFYTYDNLVYIENKTNVIITCPKHGDFELSPTIHLRGSGCKECVKEARSLPKEDKAQIFIEKAKAIHGDLYTYDNVVYVNSRIPVKITCRKHGDFEMIPSTHLQGFKCQVCRFGGTLEERQEKFIEKAKKAHEGRNYDYSKVKYESSIAPVEIICPIHGSFFQGPNNHVFGDKCPSCAKINADNSFRLSEEEIYERVYEVHGDKYEYDFSNYQNMTSKINIKCSVHGWFKQDLANHLSGTNCPECSFGALRVPIEEIMRRAKHIHGEKYDYSQVDFSAFREKVKIICPKHGVFMQSLYVHTNAKAGCPSCAITVSNFEFWVKSVVEKASNLFATKHIMKNRKHIDVLVDKVGFEANGLIFHTEVSLYGNVKPFDYHQNKTIQAASEGITLYHIFEDEYRFKKEAVEAKIYRLFNNDSIFKELGSHTIEETAKETLDDFCNRFGFELFTDKPIRESGSDFNVVVRESSNGDILLGVGVETRGLDGEKRVTAFVENPQYNIPQEIKKQVLDYIVEKIGDGITISIPITWFPKAEDTIFFDYGFVKETQIEPQFYYFSETIFNKRFFQGEELDQEGDFNKIWNCGYHKLKYIKQ